MAELSRPSVDDADRSGGLTTGIYIARVISHLDPSFNGSIEVTLLKDQSNTSGEDSKTFIVSTHRHFLDTLHSSSWARMMELNQP